jgi:ribosomal protein S18 acetylase RimI-like enzyme
MTSASIEIRRGVPADAEALAEFGWRTFEETYGASNDPQNMADYLAANYGEEHQDRELKSPDVVTLLAELEGALVGFSQVRRSTPPECVPGEDAVELLRFYVDRPWHGRGVAQKLLAATLIAAKGLDGRRVWLTVWEINPRAIAFYTKSGFVDEGTTDFWVGSDRQTDRVLVLDLLGSEDGIR